MPHVDLYLLGAPYLERKGNVVEPDTRKVLALLAYLTVTGEQHTRDAIATLFWPELDQSRARAGLRRTLSALRTAVDPENLAISRETIALHPQSDLWLDVHEFQQKLAETKSHGHLSTEVCAACLEPLSQAVALYRDDFMAGFSLRDSPDFDDWQFFQAESLRRELAGALDRLVQTLIVQGAYEAAIEHARRRLSLDLLVEEAHRQLMQLYAWSGERNAALRQYAECERILDEELGVAPLEETTSLYEAIKEGRLPDPPATDERRLMQETVVSGHPAAVSPGHPVTPIPLVGRQPEWRQLQQAYASVTDDGYFVAIEGEAGVGKTRLAEEFIAQAVANGAVAITARSYRGEEDLAYGPFIEGLRGAVEQLEPDRWLPAVPDHVLSEATRLLPELSALRAGLPPTRPLDSPGAQSRFFDALLRLLLAIGDGPPPGILYFDDLHWADTASLDLLTYLIRRLSGRPLLVMATWRSEAVPADHRLRALLAEAQRTERATLLSLERLDADDVAELVQWAAATGVPLSDDIAARLYRETEGLPFFVVAYLLAASRKGEEEQPMPGRVRDLLYSRLAQVDETERQLLQTAAAIGRSFDFETLRAASGRSDEETVIALERLAGHGIVHELGVDGLQAPAYDFSHQKLRTLVYEETSLARRRLLHRRVAEALLNRAGRDGKSQAGQVAHHFQLAGETAQAAEYYRLAGEQARALYANTEALAHFRAALALSYPQTTALHEAIGDLQTLGGQYEAAIASYQTASAQADHSQLGRLEHKLGNIYQRRGEWDLAESHYQAALEQLDEERNAGQLADLYVDWSRAAYQQGQQDEAQARARRALEVAEASSDVDALARAHNLLGILARSRDELAVARHHLERSLALAERTEKPEERVAALNNLALVHEREGESRKAITLLQAALELSQTQGDRHHEAALHSNLADLLHAEGRHDAAMDHLKQSAAIYAEIGGESHAWHPEIWKLTEW